MPILSEYIDSVVNRVINRTALVLLDKRIMENHDGCMPDLRECLFLNLRELISSVIVGGVAERAFIELKGLRDGNNKI